MSYGQGITQCGTKTINTKRLILRRFTYEDSDSMLRNWVSDEEVQDMYGEPAYKTPEAVKGLLDKYILGYTEDCALRWAVIEKESSECIGQAAYFLVDKNNHFAEIEYCIGRAFQGKGYATEATLAIISYGFDEVHLHKVQICVRPSNIPSRKVISKCGFTYNGTLPEYFYRGGRYEDRMFFSITEEEYSEGKAHSDETFARITEMERIFRRASKKIAEVGGEAEDLRSDMAKLEAYYGSALWKEDFAKDEAGELPEDLKRGVLSEDGIYNLLESYKELYSGMP